MTRMNWTRGALVACLLAGGAAAFAAQTHDHGTATTPAPAPAATAAQTPAAQPPAGREAMQDAMMAKMRAREAKLDALVKTMDGATGEAKIETMATIIRELVQDEKAMHADMKDMHARMTGAH